MTFREILGLTAVLSACSLVYEMTVAACFVRFTGDAPLWQSLTIGLYLAALGAGAWSCSRLSRADERGALWRVELVLCVLGAASAGGILTVETALRVYQHFYAGEDASLSAMGLASLATGHAFTLVIGWLSGFELPLLIRLAREAGPRGQDPTRLVLGANYLGALAGSLAFSFWLLPAFDVTGAAAAASALNLGACAFLWAKRAVERSPARLASLGATAGAWLALALVSPALSQLNVAGFFAWQLGIKAELAREHCCGRPPPGVGAILAELWARRPDLEHVPSRLQRIDLVTARSKLDALALHFNRRPAAEPGLPHDLGLYLDRRYQFNGGAEAIYHEFLAHVPVQLFNRVPEDVLILGGGDGLLAKELLKYGGRVRSIVNVELDPAVAALAREDQRLRRLNRDSFHDSRVRVVLDDAFQFVRGDPGLYDAVYIDFPFPYTYDAAKLYTAEFFRNVARRLKPGGFGAMDYPLATQEMQDSGPDAEDLRRNSIAVNTLRAAGFRTIVPFNTESPELMYSDKADLLRPHPDEPERDPETARLLRRVAARRFLAGHPGVQADEREDLVVLSNTRWRESMLAFTPEYSRADFAFKDHGIALHALNGGRLRVLEGGRFPYQENRLLVNTVVRPILFRSLQFIERE